MILIDGHNLIAKIPGWSLQMADKEDRLIELLQDYARVKRKTIEVYFDGAPAGFANSRNFGRVKAHFIRKEITVDHVIIERVRSMGRRASQVRVVSSDREVQRGVRAYAADFVSSEDFCKEIFNMNTGKETVEKPDPNRQSAQEIAEFEEMFRRKKK